MFITIIARNDEPRSAHSTYMHITYICYGKNHVQRVRDVATLNRVKFAEIV